MREFCGSCSVISCGALIKAFARAVSSPSCPSAKRVGYFTPKDVRRQQEIHSGRDRKLEAARPQRQSRRVQAA